MKYLATIVTLAAIACAAPVVTNPTDKCTATALLTKFMTDREAKSRLGTIFAQDATYISLNWQDQNKDLQELIPWCGSHFYGGPGHIGDSFAGAASLWVEPEFAAWTIFGQAATDGSTEGAAFGNMTYVSKYSGKTVKTMFSMYANASNCLIDFLTFQTDTHVLTTAWRVNGTITYHPNPIQNGSYIELPRPDDRQVCVVGGGS